MTGEPTRRIRVLLADDAYIIRIGLRDVLETADDMDLVGEAATVLEAVRLTRELAPDVVLMDLKWDIDHTAGASAIREIKATVPTTKVVAISAYDQLMSDARRAGADTGLGKEFTRDTLLATIREVARRDIEFLAPPSEPNAAVEPLTARELDVLRLVAEGQRNRDIARILKLQVSTVKNVIHSVLDKLGADNRTMAVGTAKRLGILD